MDKARIDLNKQSQAQGRINSTAESTGGKVFGLTVAICVSIAVIMLTIKLGMVLFG